MHLMWDVMVNNVRGFMCCCLSDYCSGLCCRYPLCSNRRGVVKVKEPLLFDVLRWYRRCTLIYDDYVDASWMLLSCARFVGRSADVPVLDIPQPIRALFVCISEFFYALLWHHSPVFGHETLRINTHLICRCLISNGYIQPMMGE